MKAIIFGGLLVAALAITSMAEAQDRTPVINHRHRMEERHITRAERHHRISRMQAYHLRNRERHIMREKRMAMADGHMNRMERRHLRREERGVNRRLHHDVRADKVS